jgi:protein-tyrosine-phosphatase
MRRRRVATGPWALAASASTSPILDARAAQAGCAADLVLCMSAGHALAIQGAAGGAGPARPRTCSIRGPDVADPFGTAVGQYVTLARMLERMARQRAEQLLSAWRPLP